VRSYQSEDSLVFKDYMLFGCSLMSLNRIFKNDFHAYELEDHKNQDIKNFECNIKSHGNVIGVLKIW
jgi:hypothetical protein